MALSSSVYCDRHHAAYQNLEKGYQKWRYALGLPWVEYIEKITKVSGTGLWVKEVAKNILESA